MDLFGLSDNIDKPALLHISAIREIIQEDFIFYQINQDCYCPIY